MIDEKGLTGKVKDIKSWGKFGVKTENYAWKSLKSVRNRPCSDYNNHVWEVGKWHEEENIGLCERGFHASKLIIDAMRFVNCEFIAKVEYAGKILEEDDKLVAERMRIVELYKWNKVDSMCFSIFCVKQSMKYVDKRKFPEVFEVCKNSILAIEAVLLNDNEKTRSVARSAWLAAGSAAMSAARSAESAAWSAESAAWSAESAAMSVAWSAARSVARSAARSAAWSAAWSAESAARSVARSAESASKRLQHKWLIKYIKKNCKKVKKK